MIINNITIIFLENVRILFILYDFQLQKIYKFCVYAEYVQFEVPNLDQYLHIFERNVRYFLVITIMKKKLIVNLSFWFRSYDFL